VVFDTSAVYAKVPTELLSHEVVTLIQGAAGQEGPALKWYLPETVYLERRFQMLAKAESMFSQIQNAQKILGRNLSVSKEDMEKGVERLLNEHVTKYKLTVAPLDYGKVDWKAVVNAANRRVPPFETNNEKGFRDALVLETFMQVVQESPQPAAMYRLALVTADGLLEQAAAQRLQGHTGARVLTGLEDLKGYITTLEKEVSEALIDNLKPVAATYFYVEDDSSCLFAQANVKKRIKEEYGNKLTEIPVGAEKRENIAWRIDPPRLVDSQEKTLTWASRVIVESVATRKPQNVAVNLGFGGLSTQYNKIWLTTADFPQPSTSTQFTSKPWSGLLTTGFDADAWRHAILGTVPGRSVFEVVWSATVTGSTELKDGAVLSIEFVETTWD